MRIAFINIMKNILFAILLSLAVISNLAYAEVKAVSKTADVNVNNVNEEDFQKILALAKQGDVEAQFKLGLMYYIGESVSQDYKQAAYWFEKAATQGSADAQNNLGLMYDKGQGVTKNLIKAHMWANIAASNNGIDRKLRDSVAKKLTSEQLNKAQEMAKKCLSSKYKNCQ